MTKKLRHHILLFMLIVFPLLPVRAGEMPKYEVRAVWLTTLQGLDWPSAVVRSKSDIEKQKRQLTDILDKYHRANINTVFFQTRVRATTMFPSDASTGNEPWDTALTGRDNGNPDYDPLAFAVEECHRRGMECHAWIVTIPVGKWNAQGCKALRKRHSDIVMKIGDEGYMNPANTHTAQYLARFCSGVTRRYDIDGIHLDYIRYPETMRCLPPPAEGRKNITRIVQAIHDAVKKEKAWVKVSCSPIGKHDDTRRFSSKGWNARTRVLQDAKAWLRQGLMDAEYPMMYFKGEHFYPFLVDWSECRGVTPGLAAYLLHPRQKDWQLSDVTRQLWVSRSFGMGFCFFRSRFFTDNVKGLYDFVSNVFCPYPALVPAMRCSVADAERPLQPQRLALYSYGGKAYLAWCGVQDRSDGNYLLYNIYASPYYPVDTTCGDNLLVARLRTTELELPQLPENMYFAVTATDRYGIESTPCQMSAENIPQDAMPGWYWVTHPLGKRQCR